MLSHQSYFETPVRMATKVKRTRVYTKKRVIGVRRQQEGGIISPMAGRDLRVSAQDYFAALDKKGGALNGETLTSNEVAKLRAKGHAISIPYAGMPTKTYEHKVALAGKGILDDLYGGPKIKHSKAKDQATVDAYKKKHPPGSSRTFQYTSEDSEHSAAYNRLHANQYGEGLIDTLKKIPAEKLAEWKKLTQTAATDQNWAPSHKGKGILDKLKNVAKIGLPIAAGAAGLGAAAFFGSRNKGAKPASTYGKWDDSDYGAFSKQTGNGVVDTLKSVGKKALKYGVPIVAGLASAATIHHATKSKAVTRDAPQGTHTGRFTDSTLPYADSEIESTYRDRGDSGLKLTPAVIKSLLALQSLHTAFQPSKNHSWTSGGGVLDKVNHLAECKHCQGRGLGKDLWGGIKNIGKASLPYLVPIGLAAGTAYAGYHGIKHANDRIGKVLTGEYAAKGSTEANHWARDADVINYIPGISNRSTNPLKPTGHLNLGSLG